MQSERQPIRTIGHGQRKIQDLVFVLRSAGVETLVDVRRYTQGRRQPQFSRDRLEADLQAHGIGYEAWSDDFGGHRPKPPASFISQWKSPGFAAYDAYTKEPTFRAALTRLEERADAGEAIAIMCAETSWWKCHRRLIADELVRDGFRVLHLIDAAPGSLHLYPRNQYRL